MVNKKNKVEPPAFLSRDFFNERYDIYTLGVFLRKVMFACDRDMLRFVESFSIFFLNFKWLLVENRFLLNYFVGPQLTNQNLS